MHPVTVGICGLGRWGTSYIRTLSGIPGCRVAAVCDTNPALLEEEHPQTTQMAPTGSERESVKSADAVRTFPTLDAMLAEPGITAVVLATPDHTHYPLARAALAAGRDVLVEKPMTRTSGEAEELVDLARASGLVLAVGHTALYHPEHAALRRSLDRGELGRPVAVEATRTSSGPGPDRAAPATAALGDLAPHDLAVIISLFGLPSACRAASAADGCARVEYELLFPTEILARCVAAWQPAPHRRRLHVAGTSASLTVDEQRLPPDRNQHPLARQCLDFVECCRERRTPVSSGRLGLSVVRALEAIVLSSLDSGNWIPLPDPGKRVPGFQDSRGPGAQSPNTGTLETSNPATLSYSPRP